MKMNKRLFTVVKGVILNSLCRGLMQGGAFGEQSHRVARNPSTFCHKQHWGITVEDLYPKKAHEPGLRRSLVSDREREELGTSCMVIVVYQRDSRFSC